MDTTSNDVNQKLKDAMQSIPYTQPKSGKKQSTEFDSALQKYSADMLKKFSKRH